MKKVASHIVKILLVIIVLLTGVSLHSQSPGTPGPPPPPVGLPIDGGLIWLLLSGLVLGVFKSVQRRR